MDHNLRDILFSYFNTKLRDTLNYNDEFFYPEYDDTKNTLFFRYSAQPGNLGNILKSDPEVLSQLKSILVNLISEYENDINGIDFIFTSNGFGIILNKSPKLNIDTYVNIIGKLDSVEDINKFCRSSKEIGAVCRSKELWRKLIKSVYNFPYKYEYNYEKLYKEYVTQESRGGNIEPDPTDFSDFDETNYYLLLLVQEGIIKLENYYRYLWIAIYNDNQQLFNRLVSGSPVGWKTKSTLEDDDLIGSLTFSVDRLSNTNYKIITTLLKFTNGVIIDNADVGDEIRNQIIFELNYYIVNQGSYVKSIDDPRFKQLVTYIFELDPNLKVVYPEVVRKYNLS